MRFPVRRRSHSVYALVSPKIGVGMGLAMEDRERFACGVFPRGCSEGPSELRAECLVEGLEPHVEVQLRVIQAVERHVLDSRGEPVERLLVAGQSYASRLETMEHEVRVPALPGRTALIETAGERRAGLVEKGAEVGSLLWRWEALHLTVEAWMEEIGRGLRRVRISVPNRLQLDPGSPESSPMRAFYSAQLLMHSPDGAFASPANPPAHLREHAATCVNEGLWPAPAGEPGDRRTMLASQVRLKDRARLAPAVPPASPAAGPRPHRRWPAGIQRAA